MPANDTPKALSLFIPIAKIDEEKRVVYGVATAESPDRAGEICDYKTTKPFFEKWSSEFETNTNGKSLGNVRSMHNAVAAGKVTSISYDDPRKRIEIAAKIVDDGEWNKVLEGVYTGFSQGGRYVRRWKDDADGGLTRYTADPTEVSLVDLPCLPEATFTVMKADGSQEDRHFKTVTTDVGSTEGDYPGQTQATEASINARAMELAHADGESQVSDWYRDKARNEVLSVRPAVQGDDGVSAISPSNKMAGDVDEPLQIWDCGCADHKHVKKSEAKACRKQRRVAESIKALTESVDANLAELQKRVDHALGESDSEGDKYWKRDFSDAEREKGAKEGWAMPDGSYPIKSRKDVENAVQAFGRAKDPEKVKAHIIARAKDLGCTDCLPADWEGSTKDKDSDKVTTVIDLTKDDNAANILALTKQADDEAMMDKAALHASMVKFHAIESAKCMKASGKEQLSMLHKAAAGAHSEAYLSHSTGAADCADKSDSAWNATMKCYGMGKAEGASKDLALFTDPSYLGQVICKRAKPAVKNGVSKGLYTVSALAQCLDCLYNICQSVSMEQQIEADDSPLQAMLEQAVKSVGDILVAMAREESDELLEDDGDDVDVLTMAASLPADARAALVKLYKTWPDSTDQTKPLSKVVMSIETAGKGNINQAIDMLEQAVNEHAELVKLGARNSAADKARIQSAHDLMKDLGANCDAMANAGDEKAAQAMDMLKAQLSDATARSAALEAKIVDYGPILEVILEKVARMEARPLPAKASLFAVEKGGTGAGNGSGQVNPDDVTAMMEKMSKAERDLFLMKLALTNPVSVIRR